MKAHTLKKSKKVSGILECAETSAIKYKCVLI